MQLKIIPILTLAALFVLTAQSHANFITGIDVSHWQGNINWNSVKNDGVEFAFAKATEGVDFIDSRYVQNMNNASAAGVLIGPYHFARPDSSYTNPLDAANEANDFVDAIEPYYQTPGQFLRPVLDVEFPFVPTSAQAASQGMTVKQFVSNWTRSFIAVVENRLGFAPLIYTNSSGAENYFETDLTQYDLWIANWSYTPPAEPPPSAYDPWSDWEFWQWTDSWSVAGVAGNVDGDVFDGTLQDLMQFVVGADPSADFDGNNVVDGFDFLTLQQNLGTVGPMATHANGDANGDDLINDADLAVWESQYGGAPPLTAAVASVPEPTTCTLALAALCLAMSRRRIAAQ
jgi:GH25 family lysozyme M1 (1,4-beta-N-acetylmuramidase)